MVQSKVDMELGETPPICPRNRREPEKCGCKCFLKTIFKALFFTVSTIVFLHVLLFFPFMLPVTLVFLGARACFSKRRATASQGSTGNVVLVTEGYPAALAGRDLEMVVEKNSAVYVGIPTKE